MSGVMSDGLMPTCLLY